MSVNLAGNILDADTHEVVPAQLWGETFGPAAAELAPIFGQMPVDGHDSFNLSHLKDDATIDHANVWTIKNGGAPGAIDPRRRTSVMDFMGVKRQLVFSSGVGITGSFLASGPTDEELGFILPVDPKSRDWRGLGQELLREHNDWAIRASSVAPTRLLPVGFLDTSSVEGALAEARRLRAAGVRAMHMASAVPPGGLSPADPALDEFWDYFASNDLPVLLHLGGEYTFLRTQVWEQAPLFQSTALLSAEVLPNPYRFATVHFPAQNFLTAMILGAVFERHPRLRFGVIELGAHWVGPMMENLTRWVHWFRRRYAGVLNLSPAEYLQRNVRVTPFYFEPVGTFIERHGLEDVYCFSTDWPHFEGGNNPIEDFTKEVAPLGDAVMRKFFFENAAWIMPD